MSYPILYSANATSFNNYGLGVLKDAVSCLVTEERNGRFQLDMTYPIAGIHAEKLEVDLIIKVDAGHAGFSKNQRFRIERVDKKMDGIINIFATHVSMLARNLVLEPTIDITNLSAEGALDIWRRSVIGPHQFTTASNISARRNTTLTLKNHQNAREALGGKEGSIQSVWGGEYIFNNYHIDLRANRGGNANTLISYGRNLIDLNQEEKITNTFTSIYPYAIFRDGEKETIIILGANPVLDSENVRYFAHRRVLPVDFSREFDRDTRPTEAGLKELAEAYLNEHEIGVPQVSMSLKFVDLTKSLNHSGLVYEQLNLCDEVPVYFEQLNIRGRAKVVRVVWDVLLNQYDSLDFGEMRPGLSDRLREIEREVGEVNNNANSALTAANGKNSVFFGPTEPVPPLQVGDIWYRPNGEHTELWMWDGNGWNFVLSTAPSEVILNKIEDLEAESERMREEAEQALENARQERESLAQDLEVTLSIAETARQDASEAINHANTVENIANDAQRIAQEARDIADIATGAASEIEGMVSTANNHADNARRFAESAQSSATAATNASGDATKSAQTAEGHMTSASNSARDASLHVQTAQEILSEVSDIEGNVTTLVTTAQGHVTAALGASGQAAAHAVTAQGVLTAVNNRHGDIARLVTTAQGHVMSAESAAGDATQSAQTAAGHARTAESASGDATQAVQTAQGFAQTATSQAGYATTARQDADGFSQSASTSAGRASSSVQTAERILSQIRDEETGMQSQVTQLANQFNVTIGGISSQNLLRNSTWNNGRDHWHTNWSTTRVRTAPEADKPTSHILTLPQSTSTVDHHSLPFIVEQGIQYTVSADVRFRGVVSASGTTIFRNRIHNNTTDTGATNALWDWGRTAANVGADLAVHNTWRRVTYTFTAPASGWYRIGLCNGNNTADRIHDFREIMITRGTTQTGWQAHDSDSNDHTNTQFTILDGQISQRVTTAEMNSAITQSAAGVTTHVNNTAGAIRGEMTLMSNQFNVTIGGLRSQNLLRNSTFNNMPPANNQAPSRLTAGTAQHWLTGFSSNRTRELPLSDKQTSHFLRLSAAASSVQSGVFRVVANRDYTVSMDLRSNIAGTNTIFRFRVYANPTDSGGTHIWGVDTTPGASALTPSGFTANQWSRRSRTFRPTVSGYARIMLDNVSSGPGQTSAGRNMDYREIMVTEGTADTGWQPHSADATDRTSASFTVLDNLIDQRIKDSEGNVLSNINLTPGGVRIQGRLIHLNGQTLIDDAVIRAAHIHSLEADKLLVNSTLDAGRVNVINLNANNITTGTLHANRIRVGNAYNMATLDENDSRTQLHTVSFVNLHNRNWVRTTHAVGTGNQRNLEIMRSLRANAFQRGEVYQFTFEAFRGGGSETGTALQSQLVAIYADGGSISLGATNTTITETPTRYTVNVTVANAIDTARPITHVLARFRWSTATPTRQFFVRDISLMPMIGGTLIENNAITTDKIAAGAITAELLATNAIQVGFNRVGNTLRLQPNSLEILEGTTLRSRLGATGLSIFHNNGDVAGQMIWSPHGGGHTHGIQLLAARNSNIWMTTMEGRTSGNSIIKLTLDGNTGVLDLWDVRLRNSLDVNGQAFSGNARFTGAGDVSVDVGKVLRVATLGTAGFATNTQTSLNSITVDNVRGTIFSEARMGRGGFFIGENGAVGIAHRNSVTRLLDVANRGTRTGRFIIGELAIVWGTGTSLGVAGGGRRDTNINFGWTFRNTPAITVTPRSSNASIALGTGSATTTGFILHVTRDNGTDTSYDWIAIGPVNN